MQTRAIGPRPTGASAHMETAAATADPGWGLREVTGVADGVRSGRRARPLANAGMGVKIGLIVAVLAVSAVAVGVVAVTRLANVYAQGERIASASLRATTDLGRLRDLAQQARILARDAVIAPDDAATRDVRSKIQRNDGEFDDALTRYRGEAADPAAVRRFEELWAQYRQLRDTRLLPAAESNDFRAAATILNTQTVPITTKAFTELDTANAAERADADAIVAAARDAYRTARTLILLVLGAGLLAALALAWYVTRLVLRPLRTVSRVLDAVAEGNLTEVAAVGSRDEIGRMAHALDRANDRTRQVVQAFTETAHTLASSAEELSATSRQIAGAADEASGQAGVVSTAAEQVSANVQTVAASSEQMTASIAEIARNAADAAKVANQAVDTAQAATTTVAKLGESSQEVGNVIKVITSIAEQTNLLALNATIEAARAGDAGKGFAVVANEVKDLAQETAKATDEIGQRIVAIQDDVHQAVSAIAQISEVIARIDQFQTTIAAAVEEQTATTQEIGRNIAEAASGSGEIARNILGVASASQTTNHSVTQSQTATADVARMATELQRLATQFRV
ncbi:hypothetical protein GCM10007977_096040 [Dactylosporangium sucinum]|uniref:Methyl-accepting chemotaxis protein n=2 Tax=Dactylosporangium sucinum TaxID=1424081 RepID=A0A917X6L0_9ACTN|nr:hypothetical protein GCM10007977_096040 [Dactylosporangium sucinum]